MKTSNADEPPALDPATAEPLLAPNEEPSLEAPEPAEPEPLTGSEPPSSGVPESHRPRIRTRPTTHLDSKDVRPSWPIAIATLEQLADWPVLALRLGTLALIQACVRDLAEPKASADLVVRLRALVEALAHMPYET